MEYINTPDGVSKAINKLKSSNSAIYGLDIETNGLDFHKNDILLIQVGNREHQMVFDVYRCGVELFTLLEWLASDKTTKVLHNAVFDLSFIKAKYGYDIPNIKCTYLTEQLLTAGKNVKRGLDSVLKKYLGVNMSKDDQKSFIDKKVGSDFTDEQLQYAGEDVRHLPKLYKEMHKLITSRDLNLDLGLDIDHNIDFETLAEIEYRTVHSTVDMQVNGIYVHPQQWKELKDEASRELRKAEEELDEMFSQIQIGDNLFGNPDINYASHEQLKPALEDILGETLPDTSEDTLSQINHPVIDLILRFRKYHTRVTRYGEEFLNKNVSKVTGRVHTEFKQIGAATGRYASRNPNCFPGDVEILTEQGWSTFENLNRDVKVAQYDDGGIEFVNPMAYHKKYIEEDLIEINSESVKLIMTSDHRVLTETRDGNIKDEPAEEFYEKFNGNEQIDRKFIRAGKRKGGHKLNSEEKRSLRKAIITQAEGWVQSNDIIEISIKSDRKKNQLKECFPERWDYRGNPNRIKVHLKKEEVSDWLDKTCKFFKEDKILQLSYEDLRWFFKKLHLWDGDFTRESTFGQKEERRNVVDLTQAIGLLAGYSTKYYEKSEDFVVSNFYEKEKRYCSRVDLNKKYYEGNVYCVSVPSEKIIVRYKNQASVAWNCQNIPNDKKYRAAFCVEDHNYKMIAADFSNQEIRLLAYLSKDPTFLKAIRDGDDLHCMAASMLFDVPYEDFFDENGEVKPDMKKNYRKPAKALNFGLIYGMGPSRLARQLGITYHEAKQLMSTYFNKFPNIKDTLDIFVGNVLNTHIAVSPIDNRRVNLQSIDWDNPGHVAHAKNQAKNLPMQGGGATVMKLALCLIRDKIKANNYDADLLVTVHDELVLRAHEDEAQDVANMVEHQMIRAFNKLAPGVKMEVDALIDDHWVH